MDKLISTDNASDPVEPDVSHDITIIDLDLPSESADDAESTMSRKEIGGLLRKLADAFDSNSEREAPMMVVC